MGAPGLTAPWPDVARCSGPALARRRNGAPAGPRLGHPRAAICFCPWLWAQVQALRDMCHPAVHTHSSARLMRVHARTHTHTHTHTRTCTRTVMHKHQGDTHKHTHGLYGKATSTRPQPPPAVRILYPQEPGLEDTPSSWAPPSPSLSLSHHVRSGGALLSRGTSMWGRGGARRQPPSLPSPALGPLPHKTRRLPPTRWPFLPKPEGWGGLGRI